MTKWFREKQEARAARAQEEDKKREEEERVYEAERKEREREREVRRQQRDEEWEKRPKERMENKKREDAEEVLRGLKRSEAGVEKRSADVAHQREELKREREAWVTRQTAAGLDCETGYSGWERRVTERERIRKVERMLAEVATSRRVFPDTCTV